MPLLFDCQLSLENSLCTIAHFMTIITLVQISISDLKT